LALTVTDHPVSFKAACHHLR